jgi:hypothetical protein
MPRSNTRASYIDVTLHQAARRDALAAGQVPSERIGEPSSIHFYWALFGLLVTLIAVLVA